jgi:hypothetical protein
MLISLRNFLCSYSLELPKAVMSESAKDVEARLGNLQDTGVAVDHGEDDQEIHGRKVQMKYMLNYSGL